MLAAIFWFLVKAFFWVLFIGLLINIFSHWITTGESPAQILTNFIKHRSLERLESKQERCEHDWYDLTTKTKLQELEMYQFAYRFMGMRETSYDKTFHLIESNEKDENGETIVAERLPSQREMQVYQTYYCPKCKMQSDFSVEKVCRTAIAERIHTEAEKSKNEIERIHKEIQEKKEAEEKK